MKSFLIGTLLLFSQIVFAGSQNCSGTTTVTSGQYYYAQSTDCKIIVNKSISEGTLAVLPASPSLNDEFTIVEETSYSLDTCDGGYCWPAGVGYESADGDSIDGVPGNLLWIAETYEQGSPFRLTVKVIWDGSGWVSDYPY